MAEQVKDMTKGPSGRLIIGLALPLMLGNVCQQLYTMVDTMIVGQIVGVEALAALGAGEWHLWYYEGDSGCEDRERAAGRAEKAERTAEAAV